MVKQTQNPKIKVCPKCSGDMALLWAERKRSEGAYAPDRMHRLICKNCGFGRTERFIEPKAYPLLVTTAPDIGYLFVDNPALDILKRSIEPTNIGMME